MTDRNYCINVPINDDGASMAIANPMGYMHIEWMLRYASDLNASASGRFNAASIVASYDYLLSKHITMSEATRRLRLLRRARHDATKAMSPRETKL